MPRSAGPVALRLAASLRPDLGVLPRAQRDFVAMATMCIIAYNRFAVDPCAVKQHRLRSQQKIEGSTRKPNQNVVHEDNIFTTVATTCVHCTFSYLVIFILRNLCSNSRRCYIVDYSANRRRYNMQSKVFTNSRCKFSTRCAFGTI